MLRYCCILILFAVSLFATAQTDHSAIRQKIMEGQVTKDDLIFKGRLFLIDRFENMQFDSVRMIIDFFDAEIDDASHRSLWQIERILLYYWTRQYDRLIDYYVKREKELRYEHTPPDNRVGEMLGKWSVHDFDILEEWIDESERSDEDKSFLKMMLEALLIRSQHPDITQEKLNKQADNFINAYPHSPYDELIKKYVSYKPVFSDWGWGLGIYAGYTFANSDYFNPHFAFAMDYKLHYRKAHLILFLVGGFGKLKQDIPETVWLEGEKAPVISPGVALGYTIFNRNRLHFAPFVGFSYNYVMPEQKLTEKKPELKGYSIGGISPVIGINVDWKPYTESYSMMHTSTLNNVILNLNLKITWAPKAFQGAGSIYKGDIVYVTVGYSFDFFKLKGVGK